MKFILLLSLLASHAFGLSCYFSTSNMGLIPNDGLSSDYVCVKFRPKGKTETIYGAVTKQGNDLQKSQAALFDLYYEDCTTDLCNAPTGSSSSITSTAVSTSTSTAVRTSLSTPTPTSDPKQQSNSIKSQTTLVSLLALALIWTFLN